MLAELKVKSALHDQRIDDHDKVLVAIQEHLGTLVNKIDSFERKLLVIGALIATGVFTDGKLARGIAQALGVG